MKNFHFYHAETGVLHPTCIAVNGPDQEQTAAANCPPGHLVIEGHFDHARHCIDPLTRRAQPRPPPTAEERRAQLREEALQQIAQLEAVQPRALREAVLGKDPIRLQAIDERITELRAVLNDLKG